ncbi:MAG TPA: ECF-type sigma factor [Humisphaera sp.]
MDPTHSITQMIVQLRSERKPDADEAARRLWNHFSVRLLDMARKHLPAKVKGREDEHDVLQHVYMSFVRRHRDGHFDLGDRTDLWNLLVTMTVNKAINTGKRYTTLKRNVRREQGAGAAGDDSAPAAEGVAAPDPTPDEAAILNESLGRLLGVLPDELREIAERRLAGHSNEEIAAERGVSVRTIERKLERTRALWVDAARANGDGEFVEQREGEGG